MFARKGVKCDQVKSIEMFGNLWDNLKNLLSAAQARLNVNLIAVGKQCCPLAMIHVHTLCCKCTLLPRSVRVATWRM